MRLSTRMHAILDFALGGLLILIPWVMGFGQELAGWFTMTFGALMIGHALITNWELGVARIVEVPLHLWIDGIAGVLLALSPWVMGFDRTVWAPQVAAGLFIAGAAYFTDTVPGRERRGTETTAG